MVRRSPLRGALGLVCLALLVVLLGQRGVSAQSPPQVPAARFYGTVTINGVAAPLGTTVVAQSAGSGSLCGTGTVSDDAGSYFLDVQPFGGCALGIVFLVNGQHADQTAQLTTVSSGAIALNLTVSAPFPPPPIGNTVTYAAGWNLVGGPSGTVISGAAGPLYSFQAGDSSYQVLPNGTPLRAGAGYWAYFPAPATVDLPRGALQSLTLPMPFGKLVMIGNPFPIAAVISGAAVTDAYTPGAGYEPVTILQPGQGAWAVSFSGSVTLSIGPR